MSRALRNSAQWRRHLKRSIAGANLKKDQRLIKRGRSADEKLKAAGRVFQELTGTGSGNPNTPFIANQLIARTATNAIARTFKFHIADVDELYLHTSMLLGGTQENDPTVKSIMSGRSWSVEGLDRVLERYPGAKEEMGAVLRELFAELQKVKQKK